MREKFMLIFLALLIGLGGFTLGRITYTLSDQEEQERLYAEISSLRARLESVEMLSHDRARKTPQSATILPSPEPNEKWTGGTNRMLPVDALGDEEVLARVSALLSDVEHYIVRGSQTVDTLAEIRNNLLEEVTSNPIAYQLVLDRFLAEPESNFAQVLMPVLGQMRDPEVVSAAVTLIQTGRTTEARVIGLNLLGQLGIDVEEGRNVIRDVLRNEVDSKLLSSALAVFEPSVVRRQEIVEIHTELEPLLRHEDAEVRRRSLQALARWSFEDVRTDLIVNALNDPSEDVRAEAAYALGRIRGTSERTRSALIERINDSSEDWSVRQQAWMSLQELPMNEQSFQVYQAFKEEWEERTEGAGIK